MNRAKNFAIALVLLTSLFEAGCGGGDPTRKPVAKVTGKVSFNGQPVTGGTISFTPAGKNPKERGWQSAAGAIGTDGSFQLSTYEMNDGAIIGKGTFQYTLPAPDPTPGAVETPSPYEGAKLGNPDGEVKPGANAVELQLVK